VIKQFFWGAMEQERLFISEKFYVKLNEAFMGLPIHSSSSLRHRLMIWLSKAKTSKKTL
jgi:hypothetical protein